MYVIDVLFATGTASVTGRMEIIVKLQISSIMNKYEEALAKARAGKSLEEIFPEMKESEDERIRNGLIKDFRNYYEMYDKSCGEPKWGVDSLKVKDILAWLEKQKEQTEELSTRLNGLMQEYIKSGKDEQEQEHRLKCYKLFWDALEDSEFFEKFKQKEQKPVAGENPQTSAEILRHYLVWAGNSEEDCPYTWKTLADAIRDGIKALEEQKPAVTSNIDLDTKVNVWVGYMLNDNAQSYSRKDVQIMLDNCARYFYDYAVMCLDKPVEWSEKHIAGIFEKVGLAKIVREQGNDELNNALQDAMLELSKVGNAEWSEVDEEMLLSAIEYVQTYPAHRQSVVNWLKSIRPRKLDASKLENFDPVDVLNRIKMEWPMAWEKVVGKQEWIDEDRDMLNSILLHFNTPFHDMNDVEKKMFTWLQSLPERFSLQPKQEWSEFDKDALNDAICAADMLGNDESFNKGNPNLAKAFRVAKDWLKSLHERFNLQPQQEWSGEDEKILDNAYCWLCEYAGSLMQKNHEKSSMLYEIANRLKSLRPQPHTVSIKNATKFGNLEYERGVKDGIQSEKRSQWKPSEEQMDALSSAGMHPSWGAKNCRILQSLYSDLQKLL